MCDRFVGQMRLPAPPEALRAARALSAFSQRDAADRAGVERRYISTAETSESMIGLNLRLVDFYVELGIEFLGKASIGTEVSGGGARWRAPATPALLPADHERYHSEAFGISFRAARALLDRTQADVANEIGLSLSTVKDLERGDRWAASSAFMQEYYEQHRVQFLGWSDASTRRFFGVGVRWMC